MKTTYDSLIKNVVKHMTVVLKNGYRSCSIASLKRKLKGEVG